MKRLLKNLFARLGYHIQGTRYHPRQLLDPGHLRTIEFDDVVCRRMFECGAQFVFVQVGAFDGQTRDPLRKYIDRCAWRGVLIEPQSHAASRLRDLYRQNERIVVLQAVLDRAHGRRTLYTVASENAPDWAGGLASLDRATILKHSDLVPGLEQMIREEVVDAVPFDEVLDRLGSKRLDLLQIDAEGADAELLCLFPLDRVQPAIIHWEVKHLSKRQREECLERLAAFGYRFASSGHENMMAVLT